ncbi:MAG TPA: ABC transporter permease, partial [Dehalococcoidia bacterium]|nr:ABC transporter permease [Dehalococcoidia bacterium]
MISSNVESPVALAPSLEPGRSVAFRHGLLTFIRRKPLGVVGALIVIAFVLVAIFAGEILRQPYSQIHPSHRLEGPSSTYWLGTDDLGRDLFSRIVYGARISLFVGFGATAISITLGTILGVTSGYFGGVLDLLLQRLVDIWISFPALILIISFIAVVGPGLISVIVVLGIIGASGTTRVTRGATLGIREQTYIEGARVVGAGDLRIMLRYVLPNIFAIVLVLATVGL